MDNQEKLDELVRKMDGLLVKLDAEKANHDIEHHWVRLAIKREAQSIALRQAIIEKSLAGLVWSAIVGFGVILFEYLKAHGWKS